MRWRRAPRLGRCGGCTAHATASRSLSAPRCESFSGSLRAGEGLAATQVSHSNGTWTIAGSHNRVELNESTLAMRVQAGAVSWPMMPSSSDDMLIRAGADEFRVRLADAGEIRIAAYETGYKSGVKLTLDGFRSTGQRDPGAPLGLRLVLTLSLR